METTNFFSNFINKSRFQRTIDIAQGSGNLEKLQKAERITRRRLENNYYEKTGKISHINEYGKYLIRNSKSDVQYFIVKGYKNGVDEFERVFNATKDPDQKSRLISRFVDENGEKLDYRKIQDFFNALNVSYGRTLGPKPDPLKGITFGRGLEYEEE